MRDWLLSHEPAIRLGSFVAVFALMAVWEVLAERRQRRHPRRGRWFANVGISVLDSLVVRLVFPAAAVGLAMAVETGGWGLFNTIELPHAITVVLSILLLDFAIYMQHVMFHAVPALWRLHMVHHDDQDFDLTTGVRFHPIEIVLSIIIKFIVIAALGPPPEAVLLFAVILNVTSVFNHGNARLPRWLDKRLRWILVTPDMHRVHHSVVVSESNSNFGFNLPWWDRLFGTYTDQPRAGHVEMTLGVEHMQRSDPGNLLRLLAMPFVSATGDYSIQRRHGTTGPEEVAEGNPAPTGGGGKDIDAL